MVEIAETGEGAEGAGRPDTAGLTIAARPSGSTNGVKLLRSRIVPLVQRAQAEYGALTLGDLLALGEEWLDREQDWTALKSISLSDLGGVPQPHPYSVIHSWSDGLPECERHVLYRMAAECPLGNESIANLAASLGLSEWTVRYAERTMLRLLEGLVVSDYGAPVRWRIETVRKCLKDGREAALAHLLAPPANCPDYRRVLLKLAADTRVEGKPPEPSSTAAHTDRPKATEKAPPVVVHAQPGVLSNSERTRAVTRAGRDRPESAPQSPGRPAKPAGRTGESPIGDRLEAALARSQKPAAVGSLRDRGLRASTRPEIRNAMQFDARFVKVTRTKWALRAWGLPEYRGPTDAMAGIIHNAENTLPLEALIRDLERSFDVEPSVTRYHLAAPMFLVENGYVRLRTSNDGPYRFRNASIRHTPGIYRLGGKRVARVVRLSVAQPFKARVPLTGAAASILGVEVNVSLVFASEQGDQAVIRFPEKSPTGPFVRSIHKLAMRHAGKAGDLMTLVFDRADMSLDVCVTDISCALHGWESIQSITGLPAGAGLDEVAVALRCKPEEVRDILAGRGETYMADLLP